MRYAVAALLILALILLLKWQFPYAANSEQEQMHMLYLVMVLALVGSGILHSKRHELSQNIKYACIWLGIILMLLLGYSFRDSLTNNRVMAELVPHRANVSDDGSFTIRSREDGHFYIEAKVNNAPVLFMVDTGASDIVLTLEDAKRAGLAPETLNFSRAYQTANGVVKGAPVKLTSLRIGTIHMRDISASVNGAAMEHSLLGMRFLSELRSYKVEGNTLTLVP
ncbi:MAG: TIGR02281 family clan AA aspartic protease [Alphaproteobacteria bacterium]